jgi:hypothetical protein
MNRSSNQ